ncbi:MAG: aspartate aminotransferase family protein [Dehalococcoidia bacterium]
MAAHGRTGELMERAERYLAGGVFHHATLGRLPDDLNRVMARGQGSRLWDVEGREYIDYVMGSGPLILGHAHPEVVAAVQQQVASGSQFYNLSESLVELSETIVEAVPCAERVKYAGTGNEATLAALRLARAYKGKSKILKLEGAYHGTHDYAAWAGRHKEAFEYPYGPADSAGIPDVLAKEVLIGPFNDLDTLSAIIEENRDELAAVIVEPLQRNIPPAPGFLQGLREVTRENDVLLIFDEVVTGFRLAWGGAQEFYGVVPDMACLGKVIGGGYPIGAVVGREEVFYSVTPEAVASGEAVMLSGTFTGNPVTAAAGVATLQILQQPDTYKRLNEKGGRLGDGLKELSQMLELPAYVCQVGSVVDIMFTDREVHQYRDTWSADAERGYNFRIGLMRRGIWAPPGPKSYVSLAHTEEDIDRTLEAAEEAMRDLR